MSQLIKKQIKKRLIRIVIIASISFLVFNYILSPYKLRNVENARLGGYVFVNKLTFLFAKPQVNHLVVISAIGGRAAYLGKIIAADGQIIHIENHELHIDGRLYTNQIIDVNNRNYNKKTLNPMEYLVISATPPYQLFGITKSANIIGKLL